MNPEIPSQKPEATPKNESFDSSFFRQHQYEISEKTSVMVEEFFNNRENNILRMFDLSVQMLATRQVPPGEPKYYRMKVSFTEEEDEDVNNFVRYAIPRIVAGGLQSKRLHESLDLDSVLSGVGVGHEAIHSMFSYLQTSSEGQTPSLVPAFLRTEEITSEEAHSDDERANFQEANVLLFSNLGRHVVPQLSDLINNHKLTLDTAVIEFFDQWERNVVKVFQENTPKLHLTPEYMAQNRMPAMVEVIRNLAVQIERGGEIDPKFTVHEFRRLLRPLLDRLKEKTYF